MAAIDRAFDYLVPDSLGPSIRLGSVVRIELHGRRIRGWVVADDVEPPKGVRLLTVAKVTGWGPAPDLLDLAEWAAWRWAGKRSHFCQTATSERAVPRLPPAAARPPDVSVPGPAAIESLADEALQAAGRSGVVTLRLPPAADPFAVLVKAAALGDCLVLAPALARAGHLGARLRRAGLPAAVMPGGWPQARAGCSFVVGARAAAWAPVRELGAAVVLDEHDEAYQEERAPTWHARDVVIERARRCGARVVLVSPMPTLEALAAGPLIEGPRAVERAGWPILDTVDMRREDPARGILSELLTEVLRSGARVVCVLNRKGRARLLACATCGDLARCDSCQARARQNDDAELFCGACGQVRPMVCQSCGGTKLKNLRVGVARLREEIEALAGTDVVEVTAEHRMQDMPTARVFIGTESVLHQIHSADVVAYLDFDQELLAPRYRAAEQALALVVRGARLVGGRSRARFGTGGTSPQATGGSPQATGGPLPGHAGGGSPGHAGGGVPGHAGGGVPGHAGGGVPGHAGGRLIVQTRMPDHEVIQAARLGDPSRMSRAEGERRELLRLPPMTALAAVSGAAAGAFVDSIAVPGVEVLGPSEGVWLLRSLDHETLCDVIARTPRPAGRLRIEVDPSRI